MSIFPKAEQAVINLTDELVELAFDFEKNELKTKGGRYYTVSGNEALRIWVYKVLNTPRGMFAAYTQEYGHRLKEVFGMADREEFEGEVKLLLEDALKSPYIEKLSDFKFEYDRDRCHVKFAVNSIFGTEYEEAVI